MKLNKNEKTADQRRRKIKAAMTMRGITGSGIARDLCISRAAVSSVIAGRMSSRKVVQALIDAGVPAGFFDVSE